MPIRRFHHLDTNMTQKLCMMTGEDEVRADSLEEGSPVLSDGQRGFFCKYLPYLLLEPSTTDSLTGVFHSVQ